MPDARTAPGRAAALWTSVKAGLGATAIALVLGTMAAFAVQRYRFFGRDTVSLPGDPADRAARASSPASRCNTAFRTCSARSASRSGCSP